MSAFLAQGYLRHCLIKFAGPQMFSIPGLEAFPLLSQSSGLTAHSALVAIGVVGDPGTDIGLIVQDVAEGVIKEVLGDYDLPERIYFSVRLKRFLLKVENSITIHSQVF